MNILQVAGAMPSAEPVSGAQQAGTAFSNIGWNEMMLMALIGFLMVFVILVLMIYVMKIFGYTFTRNQSPKEKAKQAEYGVVEEEVAAIAVALKMYKSALHDQESTLVTIQRMNRAYSPWNSKIHGLTPLPERNVRR